MLPRLGSLLFSVVLDGWEFAVDQTGELLDNLLSLHKRLPRLCGIGIALVR